MTTFITPEQFVAAGKANVETLLALTNANFARAERLVALNLNTARSVLEDGVANAKALLAAKDVQSVANLQAGFAQPLVDKAVGGLSPASYDRAVKLAALPDLIRGYEDVKLANVRRFREEVRALGF